MGGLKSRTFKIIDHIKYLISMSLSRCVWCGGNRKMEGRKEERKQSKNGERKDGEKNNKLLNIDDHYLVLIFKF